jgi:mono/diheme cytochrome c family protein
MKTNSPSVYYFLSTVGLALTLFFVSGCAPRSGLEKGGEDFLASGEATYTKSCASCHGADARGNGPVAELLTVPASDLTQLRRRYDGRFPVDELYSMIEGNEKVGAHGTREMPVWGNIWSESDGKPVRREVIENRISELIEYLRSIQTE